MCAFKHILTLIKKNNDTMPHLFDPIFNRLRGMPYFNGF